MAYVTRMTETGAAVICPTGRMTMVTAPALREAIRALVDEGNVRVVVDLAGVEYIDSLGLGALMSGLRVARQAGGDLRIAAPNRQIQSVLQSTSVDRVLSSYESAEAAFT